MNLIRDKEEPISKNNPLLKSPNLILTPHLGGSTKEAKAGVSTAICRQVKNYLVDQDLQNVTQNQSPYPRTLY